MIIDSIENFSKYNFLEEDINAIIAKAESLNLNEIQIISNGYYSIQEGTSTHYLKKEFEKHQEYIDIHLILEGIEVFSWEVTKNAIASSDYSEKKDVQFYISEDKHFFKVDQNMFYVVYPWDLHKPSIYSKVPYSYKKIVFKIKVNYFDEIKI